jgi:hypothetical protein
MPPIQLYYCENVRSHICPQFSYTTVRMSGLTDAPHSAIPLWERQVSQMPPIQLYHCENVRSRSCPHFSNTTVRMSRLTDATNSAIPLWERQVSQLPPIQLYLWKGKISEIPPQFVHVSHVDLFEIIAQTAWWLVVTCSLYNIRPLLNSTLKPEQTFSGMATGHLHI